MRVVDRVRVVNFGQRRKHDHTDRPVAAVRPPIPGNEDRAMVLVGLRAQNRREVVAEPGVPRGDTAIGQAVAEVGGDEVVAGDGVVLQIGRELTGRSDVRGAARRIGIVVAGDILEEDEGVVACGISPAALQRARGAADVPFIGLPRDAGGLEVCRQMSHGARGIRRTGVSHREA